jgi:hypothetical protein
LGENPIPPRYRATGSRCRSASRRWTSDALSRRDGTHYLTSPFDPNGYLKRIAGKRCLSWLRLTHLGHWVYRISSRAVSRSPLRRKVLKFMRAGDCNAQRRSAPAHKGGLSWRMSSKSRRLQSPHTTKRTGASARTYWLPTPCTTRRELTVAFRAPAR